ncbi:XkdX family protein [Paenibacillus sp. GCM10012307]|uniref:XkdX family protein n=1 Tax=Paenibacillus roseus TaxID=2798579 RepID=A0A934J2H6_9BACL|nr:XkdX family protein [Paenibacillus roseus]MBJ6362084.1 XkdX family protein [Paenibacillus roseus]
MNWYPHIKQYYKQGFYTEANIQVFVAAGWITTEQADDIIGSA